MYKREFVAVLKPFPTTFREAARENIMHFVDAEGYSLNAFKCEDDMADDDVEKKDAEQKSPEKKEAEQQSLERTSPERTSPERTSTQRRSETEESYEEDEDDYDEDEESDEEVPEDEEGPEDEDMEDVEAEEMLQKQREEIEREEMLQKQREAEYKKREEERKERESAILERIIDFMEGELTEEEKDAHILQAGYNRFEDYVQESQAAGRKQAAKEYGTVRRERDEFQIDELNAEMMREINRRTTNDQNFLNNQEAELSRIRARKRREREREQEQKEQEEQAKKDEMMRKILAEEDNDFAKDHPNSLRNTPKKRRRVRIERRIAEFLEKEIREEEEKRVKEWTEAKDEEILKVKQANSELRLADTKKKNDLQEEMEMLFGLPEDEMERQLPAKMEEMEKATEEETQNEEERSKTLADAEAAQEKIVAEKQAAWEEEKKKKMDDGRAEIEREVDEKIATEEKERTEAGEPMDAEEEDDDGAMNDGAMVADMEIDYDASSSGQQGSGQQGGPHFPVSQEGVPAPQPQQIAFQQNFYPPPPGAPPIAPHATQVPSVNLGTLFTGPPLSGTLFTVPQGLGLAPQVLGNFTVSAAGGSAAPGGMPGSTPGAPIATVITPVGGPGAVPGSSAVHFRPPPGTIVFGSQQSWGAVPPNPSSHHGALPVPPNPGSSQYGALPGPPPSGLAPSATRRRLTEVDSAEATGNEPREQSTQDHTMNDDFDMLPPDAKASTESIEEPQDADGNARRNAATATASRESIEQPVPTRKPAVLAPLMSSTGGSSRAEEARRPARSVESSESAARPGNSETVVGPAVSSPSSDSSVVAATSPASSVVETVPTTRALALLPAFVTSGPLALLHRIRNLVYYRSTRGTDSSAASTSAQASSSSSAPAGTGEAPAANEEVDASLNTDAEDSTNGTGASAKRRRLE